MWEQLASAGVSAGVSSLLGGSKNSARSSYKNTRKLRQNVGVDARIAAEQSGFNPLTMLAAQSGSGVISGDGSSGIPLASQAVLAGIQGVSDEYIRLRQVAAADKKWEEEIAARKLEQAQGIYTARVGAPGAQTVLPKAGLAPAVSSVGPVVGGSVPWYNDGRRSHENMPSSSAPGITEISNPITGRIFIPGADGEPWGIDEVATAAIVGGPQILARAIPDYAREMSATSSGLVDQIESGVSLVGHSIADAWNGWYTKDRKPSPGRSGNK